MLCALTHTFLHTALAFIHIAAALSFSVCRKAKNIYLCKRSVSSHFFRHQDGADTSTVYNVLLYSVWLLFMYLKDASSNVFFSPYVSAHVSAADASFWKYCSRNGAQGFRGKQSHLTKLMLWCGWKPPKWQQPSAPHWVVNLATAPRFSPSLIWNCHARTVIVLLCKMRFNLCAHISTSTFHIMIFAGSRKRGLDAGAMTFSELQWLLISALLCFEQIDVMALILKINEKLHRSGSSSTVSGALCDTSDVKLQNFWHISIKFKEVREAWRVNLKKTYEVFYAGLTVCQITCNWIINKRKMRHQQQMNKQINSLTKQFTQENIM